jgi:hypothetical protein
MCPLWSAVHSRDEPRGVLHRAVQWLATATPEELAREMKRCLLKAIRAFEDATIALTKLRGW